jgi:hypothetical protein
VTVGRSGSGIHAAFKHLVRTLATLIRSAKDARRHRDAYYGKVADKVMEQIKLSGWLIEPPQTLQKKLPVK